MKKLLLIALLFFTTIAHAADDWPELKWDALIPKDWDPRKEFKELNLGKIQDSDPRAMEALEKMKAMWDNAPAEPSLNGKKLRIAGFALPLERKGDKVTEFLLVPYFGACIHSPPPPANQIIVAASAKPLSGIKMMTPVWVFGSLATKRGDTTWGVAGYRLTVDKIAPYEEPHRR